MRQFLDMALLVILAFLIAFPVQSDAGSDQGPQDRMMLSIQTTHDCAPSLSSQHEEGEEAGCHETSAGCVKDCCLLMVLLPSSVVSDKLTVVFVDHVVDLAGMVLNRLDPPPIA